MRYAIEWAAPTRGKVVRMNSRWAARIIGILLLLGFILLMVNLQKKLVEIQQQGTAPTSTR